MSLQKIGKYIEEFTKKNKNDAPYPVYSVTNSNGFCTDYFSKDVSGQDKTTYKIVPKGYFAYNPSRINVGSIDWQNSEDNVIVSPLYVVFKCSDSLDQDYLKYFLKSSVGVRLINEKTSGSVRNSLKFKELSEFELNIVDVEEQRKIVNTLKLIESAIENEKKQINLYDELVKARFVEMFGDFESNSKQLEIETLGQLGFWSSGGTPSRTNPDYFTGDINWYSAGELNSLFLDESIEKITKEAINNSAAKLFKAGSMLVGMYDTAAFKMGILKEDSASNQACACIEPNERIDIVWLYYALTMMKNHYLSQRRGVRQKNLNLGMIKDFKLPIAQKNEQLTFVSFVKQIDKSKFVAKKRLKLYEELLEKKTYDCYIR